MVTALLGDSGCCNCAWESLYGNVAVREGGRYSSASYALVFLRLLAFWISLRSSSMFLTYFPVFLTSECSSMFFYLQTLA